MIRHVLASAVAIALIPADLVAQTTLTIEATSTDVHESPTGTAPVIGRVPRGRVLEVTREDGDWVTVTWPKAATGVAYVRLTIGSVARTSKTDAASLSAVRADVEAVDRAILAIWIARSDSTAVFHVEPSR